jgi:hypothetical protein
MRRRGEEKIIHQNKKNKNDKEQLQNKTKEKMDREEGINGVE